MRRTDLTVRTAWSASAFTNFENGGVLGKSGGGHGADDAKGERGEGKELHSDVLGGIKFEVALIVLRESMLNMLLGEYLGGKSSL